jgi:hypothetical protein
MEKELKLLLHQTILGSMRNAAGRHLRSQVGIFWISKLHYFIENIN